MLTRLKSPVASAAYKPGAGASLVTSTRWLAKDAALRTAVHGDDGRLQAAGTTMAWRMTAVMLATLQSTKVKHVADLSSTHSLRCRDVNAER